MATYLNDNWNSYSTPVNAGWVLTVGTTADFTLSNQTGDPVFDSFGKCLQMINDSGSNSHEAFYYLHANRPTLIDFSWGVEAQWTDRVPSFIFTNADDETLLAVIPAHADATSATNNIYINGVDTGIQNPTQKRYRMVVDNFNYTLNTYDIEIFENEVSVYTQTGVAFHSAWNDTAIDRIRFLGAGGDSGAALGSTYLDAVNIEGTAYPSVALLSLSESDARYTYTKAELELYGFLVTTVLDADWTDYTASTDFTKYDMLCIVRSTLSSANLITTRADGVPILAGGIAVGKNLKVVSDSGFKADGVDVYVVNDTHPIWVAQGKSETDVLSRPIWYVEYKTDAATACAGTILAYGSHNLEGPGDVEVIEMAATPGQLDTDSNPFEARLVWAGWWYPASNPHTAPYLELRPHLQAAMDWLLLPDEPDTPTLSVDSAGLSSASFSGSAYSDPDSDPHSSSQWQVDVEAGDFSTPVVDSGEDFTNLTSYTASGLDAGTDYKARVRYRDDQGNWSAYSTAVSFTTQSSNFTENPDTGTDRFSDCAAGTDRFSPCGGAGTDRFTSC